VPWYLGLNKIPNGLSWGDWKTREAEHFNRPSDLRAATPAHSFWTFSDFSTSVCTDYQNNIKIVAAFRNKNMKKLFKNQTKFEADVLKVLKTDAAKATEMLNQYTATYVEMALKFNKEFLAKTKN